MTEFSNDLAMPPKRQNDAGKSGLTSCAALALGTFAVGTDAFIVAGFLPSMAADLSVSLSTAGQSVTVFAIAYGLLAPIIASIGATVPRRTLLVSALLMMGIANLASAYAPAFSILLLTRLLAAASAAAFTPTAAAESAGLVGFGLRARALAIVIGGLTLSTALGVPLGNLASSAMSWRAALEMVAGIAFAASVLTWILLPPIPGKARTRNRISVAGHPRVLSIILLTLLGMTACYIPYAYSVALLHAVGVSNAAVAVMLVLYGAGAVAGNMLSGYGTDKWGGYRVLRATYAAMTLAFALLAWMSHAHIALDFLTALAVFAWGASSWAQSPAQQHRLIQTRPEEAALVVALNSSCIYFGIALGSLAGGLSIRTGVAPMMWVAVIVALLALAYLALSERHFRKRQADELAPDSPLP